MIYKKIEKYTPLGESLLWDLLKKFYIDHHIYAWEKVPNRITANPLLALHYVKCINAFIYDHKNSIRKKDPLYIIEIGSGNGKFSYYMLNELSKLNHSINLKYICTDISIKNLNFTKSHSKIKPFINNECCDFSLLDITEFDGTFSTLSNKEIKKKQITNPLIVICNYVFDTVTHDAFFINKKNIFQTEVKLKYKRCKTLTPENLNLSFRSLKKHHSYNDLIFDKLIQQYKEKLTKSHIFFSPQILNFIKKLREMSSDQLCILTADKGHQKFSELNNQTSLNFQKHGSLSIPVNFHALYSYVKLTGGSVLKQKQSSNLYTSMIIYSNNDLIYTKSNFNQTIYSYPVSSLYKNKDNADKEIKMSFNKIVKEIYLSNFCPFVILKSYQELLDASSKFKKNKIKLIYFICQTISKNTYQCEGEQQPYEKIANLFFMNNHFIEARDSYHKFLKLNPKDFKATYNYALCHYKLNHPLKALSSFQKAASIKRTLDTDYWISKIMNNQKLTL